MDSVFMNIIGTLTLPLLLLLLLGRMAGMKCDGLARAYVSILGTFFHAILHLFSVTFNAVVCAIRSDCKEHVAQSRPRGAQKVHIVVDEE